jgi:hypothetical protein
MVAPADDRPRTRGNQVRASDRHGRWSAAIAVRAALALCASAGLLSLGAAQRAQADEGLLVDCDAGTNLQHVIDTIPEIASNNLGVLRVAGHCRGNFRIINRRFFTLRGVTRNGKQAVLDGQNRGPALDINSCCGGTLELDNLKIQNGVGRDNGGGGIAIHGLDVTMRNMTIVHNRAAHWGGGIVSGNFLKIHNSYIASNSADMGGGIFIYHNGADISDTTIAFNHANSHGGGVYSSGNQWEVKLTRSIVANNTSDTSTPGVIAAFVAINSSGVNFNRSKAHAQGAVSGQTQIIVHNSSIVGNEGGTGSHAGGLCCSYVSLKNSTVANNVGATAGGVYAQSLGATATTFSGNRATATDGSGGGGAIYSGGNRPNLRATILAGNAGSNPDCFSYYGVISEGYNLIGNNKNCEIAFGGSGDKVGTPAAPINPLLGQATYQEIGSGSGYPVMPLLAGSRAIDAIPSSACPFAHDQRGQTRPSGAGCDIGAYEVHPGH